MFKNSVVNYQNLACGSWEIIQYAIELENCSWNIQQNWIKLLVAR